MQGTTDDIRYGMRETRAELDGTLAEVRERIGEARSAVTESLDLLGHTREHPWIAIGLALAAGVALGSSGADRRIVAAVQDAGEAAGGRVSDAKDAIVDRVSDLGGAGVPGIGRARERVGGQIQGLLADGLVDLLRGLGRRG